jgi:hypothetical protein
LLARTINLQTPDVQQCTQTPFPKQLVVYLSFCIIVNLRKNIFY